MIHFKWTWEVSNENLGHKIVWFGPGNPKCRLRRERWFNVVILIIFVAAYFQFPSRLKQLKTEQENDSWRIILSSAEERRVSQMCDLQSQLGSAKCGRDMLRAASWEWCDSFWIEIISMKCNSVSRVLNAMESMEFKNFVTVECNGLARVMHWEQAGLWETFSFKENTFNESAH